MFGALFISARQQAPIFGSSAERLDYSYHGVVNSLNSAGHEDDGKTKFMVISQSKNKPAGLICHLPGNKFTVKKEIRDSRFPGGA